MQESCRSGRSSGCALNLICTITVALLSPTCLQEEMRLSLGQMARLALQGVHLLEQLRALGAQSDALVSVCIHKLHGSRQQHLHVPCD